MVDLVSIINSRARYAWVATGYTASRRITGVFIRTCVVGRRVDRRRSARTHRRGIYADEGIVGVD